MPPRFLLFFSIVTTLLFAVHGYLGYRLIGPSPLTGAARTAAWVLVFANALLLPAAMSARFVLRGAAADAVAWVGFVALGLFSFVLVFTVLRDVAWLVMAQAGTLPVDPARRTALLHLTNLVVLGSAAGAAVLGVMGARARAAVKNVQVPIANLPAALEGFTIVQLTDIHVGPTIKKGYIDAVVDAVNGLDAHVVAVTGDVVDGSVDALDEHTAPLGRMKSKYGTFFCTGNHEYYSGAEEWIAEFRRLGMTCLQNQHVVLDHGGARVVVAGVTDFNAAQVLPAHKSDPQQAIAGAPADAAVKLLLAHQPRSCAAAAECGFDLQLSGHTHGGQFFPWMFFVPLQQPFVAGLDRLNDLWVYTSRGTGYWGPPVRLGAPSEITRLRLVRAA